VPCTTARIHAAVTHIAECRYQGTTCVAHSHGEQVGRCIDKGCPISPPWPKGPCPLHHLSLREQPQPCTTAKAKRPTQGGRQMYSLITSLLGTGTGCRLRLRLSGAGASSDYVPARNRTGDVRGSRMHARTVALRGAVSLTGRQTCLIYIPKTRK
jgi:hypothetical protein